MGGWEGGREDSLRIKDLFKLDLPGFKFRSVPQHGQAIRDNECVSKYMYTHSKEREEKHFHSGKEPSFNRKKKPSRAIDHCCLAMHGLADISR